MSTTVQQIGNHTWQLQVSGILKKAELDAEQAVARLAIERVGKIKVLLKLEAFQGWEKGADWGDVSFAADCGDDIERIAIVGEPRWEGEALMFTGAGIRRTPKFFTLEEEALARAWLEKDAE